jgi:hypothetical protein
VNVFKKVLISLGGIFVAVFALFVWLGMGSAHFRTEQEPFVRTFVSDLSKRWVVSDVYDRLANPFIEQAGTVQGKQLLQQFKQLGALKAVRDVELRNYNLSFHGQTGIFTFKGTFEHGEAIVDVTIIKKDAAVRVLGIYITSTHMQNRDLQENSQA